ncbi:hypothetical protein Tco_0842418 [Tanacetum coccineum]|uniref:Uncharacterized protein n=1 Tax=Tanacetum coccineum TaxID=301880 RepID=A0ABQ5AZ81_9ASTR
MYKEYLAEFWYSDKALENSKVSFSVPTGGIYGEVGVNTFRNAIGAHYLAQSSEYVAPPSINIVRPWFETIGYGETVPVKGALKKSLFPPRWRFLSLLMMHKMKEGYGDSELTLYPTQVFSVNNWALKPKQPEEPLFTYHMLAICSATELVAFKAPKPSSNAKRVPQGTKPGAQPGYKKQLTSLKQPSVSSKEATKGGSSKAPTSFKTGHSKKRKESNSAMDSNPSQPPVSTLVDTGMHKEDQQATGGPTSLRVTISTADDPGNSTPSDFIPQQQGMNEGTKNTSYDYLFAGTNTRSKSVPFKAPSSFFEKNKAKVEVVLLKASTILSTTHLLTELKDLPSKFNELTEEVKGLKKQVHELEIELPGDLKEIPSKLEDFTKIVTSLTSQVTELKTLQWELPTEFVSLLVLDSASSKAEDQGVPSVGQADTITNQCTKENRGICKVEAAKRKGKMRKEELIDLLGPEVVNKYYNDKLQYDRYCNKMLNRRAKSRITNYDILTRKGLITLKVYREYVQVKSFLEFKA